MWALNNAIHAYYTDDWENIVKNALNTKFSWDNSAKEYIKLYEKIIAK